MDKGFRLFPEKKGRLYMDAGLVEERSTVQNVDATDAQHIAFSTKKLND